MANTRIKINSSGFIISSAVVAGLSLFALLKSDSYLGKSMAASMLLSSVSVGAVTKLKTGMDERDANAELQQIIESVTKEKSDFDTQLKAVTESNKKLKTTALDLGEKLHLSINNLEQLKAEYSILKTNLLAANEEIKVKSQELIDHENNVDTRFQNFLKEFVGKVVNTLYDKISLAYNSLDANCLALLAREEYSSIHDELVKFRAGLETHHDGHIALTRDLEAFDYTTIHTLIDANVAAAEVMERYNQITDEMLALKVKYRNLKTLDERRALQEFQETEEYKTTKAIAIQTLREQTNLDKSVIDRLQAGLSANTNGLSELISGIGTDLEKANERVAQLSAPITWKFAVNHATRAGNLIIEYCKANRIHLDRSHYTGDAYEVDLYFFTDRINAAQTVDVKALNDEGEKLAQITHCLEPIKFTYEYESRLLIAHLVLQHRTVEKKQPTDPVLAVKEFIKPIESLLPFIKDAYHIGLWASTGGGKTTAISNIIGGMSQELGGNPTIRLTIPKIDAATQSIFPDIHWLGISESIFGLLEAALEIQYRIHINEKAFRAKEIIQDFDAMIFFIDEINGIFTRWGAINDADLEDVLSRFEATLKGERLVYFRDTMRIELTNYKNQFAKKLLLFIWQTGRSLRVKSLIAGQNLQPGNFGLKVNDLANCSYLSMGASIKPCAKYKVREGDIDLVSKQYELLQKVQEIESNLQYTALYCPSVGKSFFGILPPPNYYKWDANLLNAQPQPTTQPITTHKNLKMAETSAEQEGRHAMTENLIQKTPQLPLEHSNSKRFKLFEQRALLPEKYQNLDFKGYADLLASLPKKDDGSVNKKLAYGKTFKIWKTDLRQVYSSFIDWLEANFK